MVSSLTRKLNLQITVHYICHYAIYGLILLSDCVKLRPRVLCHCCLEASVKGQFSHVIFPSGLAE